MSIDHHFYMDTSATQHELRDVLIRAGLGFEAEEDWAVPSTGGLGSGAVNEATLVSIRDISSDRSRPGNGVIPTRKIGFSYRKTDLDRFERDTTLSIVALLRAYPDADAFWDGFSYAGVPMLPRRHGRLVLSEVQTKPEQFWNVQDHPYRALVDLPYVVEPLGPWWP